METISEDGEKTGFKAYKEQINSLRMYKETIKAELSKLEANSTAKEVAGKAIGKNGLVYITIIVVIGVAASLFLDQDKIAAVMGLLGSSLTALISMLASIAGASEKQEKPEFAVIKDLIDKLDKLDKEEVPMKVDVDGGNVVVTRGNDVIRASENSHNKTHK
jgi:hypothetical protein